MEKALARGLLSIMGCHREVKYKTISNKTRKLCKKETTASRERCRCFGVWDVWFCILKIVYFGIFMVVFGTFPM